MGWPDRFRWNAGLAGAVVAVAASLGEPPDARGPLVRARGRGEPTTIESRTRGWESFARDAQHTAQSFVTADSLNRIHWQMPVDLKPQYASGELLIHYGSPLITAANTVIVPVKTGASGGFRVEARDGSDGTLKWLFPSDYSLPPHGWTPEFGPVLAGSSSLYVPGAGGTVYVRDDPDESSGTQSHIAFYGLANYQADAAAYDAAVAINTPLTADTDGNIYFGFMVYGTTPLNLASGVARLGANGEAAWTSVTAAAGDPSMTQVVHNCAPALSLDKRSLYVAVSDGTSGYLVSLDSTTLAPLARVRLTDPLSGGDSWLDNDGSSSPSVGPDGDVYFGVSENPLGENNARGWLLHFDAGLSRAKTTGAFGWDDTISFAPASMVPSYAGSSPYLLVSKYNNYFEFGGDGRNRIAVLDPNGTQKDPVTGITVMSEVLSIEGPSPDGAFPRVKEWCINSAAVDPSTRSVLANSEDGKLYRWDLSTNTLSETVVLTPGLGEAYTPTVIGVDGTVYAINNATLFAVGK